MKVVLFTAGTESTALLIHTINMYGVSKVVALTTIINTVPTNPLHKHYTSTEFYTTKICKELGVKHIIARKDSLGNEGIGWYGMLQFIPDAYNVVLADPAIDAVFVGAHSKDNHNSYHIQLGWTLFNRVMTFYKRYVQIFMPLKDISKADQYKLIPDNIKQYVWTCDFYESRVTKNGETIGYNRCHKCSKCVEFDLLVGISLN